MKQVHLFTAEHYILTYCLVVVGDRESGQVHPAIMGETGPVFLALDPVGYSPEYPLHKALNDVQANIEEQLHIL